MQLPINQGTCIQYSSSRRNHISKDREAREWNKNEYGIYANKYYFHSCNIENWTTLKEIANYYNLPAGLIFKFLDSTAHIIEDLSSDAYIPV